MSFADSGGRGQRIRTPFIQTKQLATDQVVVELADADHRLDPDDPLHCVQRDDVAEINFNLKDSGFKTRPKSSHRHL